MAASNLAVETVQDVGEYIDPSEVPNEKLIYWLKSQFALYITREAIKPFVKTVAEQFLKETLDDICRTKGISQGTTCSSCSLQNILHCRTKGVCTIVSNQCNFHDEPTKQYRTCQKSICNELCNRIIRSHRYFPVWLNMDSTLWCTEPFQICKCYMSKDGYAHVWSFEETDFNGLINVMINHKGFEGKMADDLSKPGNICCKARQVGRDIRHSNLSVEADAFSSYIDVLLGLLSDQKKIINNTKAQEACWKLNQLKTADLVISEDTKNTIRHQIRGKKLGTEEADLCLKQKIDNAIRSAEFKVDLIHYYRNRHSTFPISPLHEDTDERLVELYVHPEIYVPGPYGKVAISNYHELFHEKLGNKQKPKELNEIYITSASGIGKTSYGKRMATAWGQAHDPIPEDQEYFDESDLKEMKSFEFFFFIPLRNIKSSENNVDDMILQEIIPDLAGGHIYEAKDFLLEILRQHRCLIFLDGLDEYTYEETRNSKRDSKIPKRKVRKSCTYVTTTRPWKLDNVRLTKTQIQRKAEIGGLSTESADKLTKLVIAKLNDTHREGKSSDDCKAFLERRKLQGLKSIPIILLQLICLWYAGFRSLGRSKCEGYSNILELLFSRTKAKYPGFKITDIFKLAFWFSQLPDCFRQNSNCKRNKMLILSLGKLSFNALFTGKTESQYVIEKHIVKRYISKDELKYCLKVGLLTLVKGKVPILDQKQSYAFLHQTYQEFLAGLFISSANSKETNKLYGSACRSVVDVVEMSTIFVIISGLCPDSKMNLLSSILSVQAKDPCVKEYIDFIDHGDTNFNLKRLQAVVLDCLQEREDNGHGNMNLYLVCIFIRGGKKLHHLKNLKRVLTYNAKRVKAIDIADIDEDTANELALEQTISSVEKLSIYDCKMTALIQRLVSRFANTLSCLQLRSVLPGASFLSALQSCHSLRNISLWDIKLTHEALDSLVSFLSANKEMKQIELRSIVCVTENEPTLQCEGHSIDFALHSELETFDVFDTNINVNALNNESLKHCALRSFPRTDDLADILLLLENSGKLRSLVCTNLADFSRLNDILPTLGALTHLEAQLVANKSPVCDNESDCTIQISSNMTSLERVTLRHVRMTKAAFRQFQDELLHLEQMITVHLGDGTFNSTEDYKYANQCVECNTDCKKAEADGMVLAFNTTDRRSIQQTTTETRNSDANECDKFIQIKEKKHSFLNIMRKLVVVFLGVILFDNSDIARGY